jgi:hypothetical protein
VQRQNPLRPFDLPKPQLTSLLTSSRSMGLLDGIVTPRPRNHPPMIHRLEPEEFANGCAVTRQLVGTNRFWEVVLAQQALEKVLGRSRIPVSLKHHLEHRAVFVHRSPQPVGIAPMSTCISSRCPRESRRVLRWRNPRANSLLNVMHGCESMLETSPAFGRTGVKLEEAMMLEEGNGIRCCVRDQSPKNPK